MVNPAELFDDEVLDSSDRLFHAAVFLRKTENHQEVLNDDHRDSVVAIRVGFDIRSACFIGHLGKQWTAI